MSAVLRVAVAEVDGVDAWLARFSAVNIERAWRAGERDLRGRVSSTSGVIIVLSEAEDGRALVREAATAFADLAPLLAEMVREGATAEIDFALFVSGAGSRSIAFEPATVRLIQECGVRIVVSAYPCAEDDDAEQPAR
jgi:hypothetical protein